MCLGKEEVYSDFAKPSSYPVSIPQNNAFINLHCSVCHSVLPTSETKCDSLLNYFNLCWCRSTSDTSLWAISSE